MHKKIILSIILTIVSITSLIVILYDINNKEIKQEQSNSNNNESIFLRNITYKKDDLNKLQYQISQLENRKYYLYEVELDYKDNKTKNAVKGYDYTDKNRYQLIVKNVKELNTKNELVKLNDKNIKPIKLVSEKFMKDHPKYSTGTLYTNFDILKSDYFADNKEIKFYDKKNPAEINSNLSVKMVDLKKKFVKEYEKYRSLINKYETKFNKDYYYDKEENL